MNTPRRATLPRQCPLRAGCGTARRRRLRVPTRVIVIASLYIQCCITISCCWYNACVVTPTGLIYQGRASARTTCWSSTQSIPPGCPSRPGSGRGPPHRGPRRLGQGAWRVSPARRSSSSSGSSTRQSHGAPRRAWNTVAFFPWLSSRFAVVSVLFIANHGLLHRERRSLFVKYVQSGMHYQDRRYNHRLPALTALQRAVLEMPADDDAWHNESRHPASAYTVSDRTQVEKLKQGAGTANTSAARL